MRVLIAAAALLVNACQATSPNAGSGPLTLSVRAQAFFEQYKNADNPEHFAISFDGSAIGATTCPAARCQTDLGGERAISVCERTGKKCKIFAVGREIVWNGQIHYLANTSESKRPVNVAWGWPSGGQTIWHSGYADFSGDASRPRIVVSIDGTSCSGVINVGESTWSMDCAASRKFAKGTISTNGEIWEGAGWDNNDSRIEIKVNPLSPPVPGTLMRRPIAFSWDGYSALGAGTVTLSESGRAGLIAVSLPNGEATCEGQYEYTGRAWGTWTLECSNGLAASGTFEGLGAGKGSRGIGKDTKGRSVNFTVGARHSLPGPAIRTR